MMEPAKRNYGEELEEIMSDGKDGKQVGHPHAALMIQYGEIALTNPRPWESVEFEYALDKWVGCLNTPEWDVHVKYRIIPPPKKKVVMYQAVFLQDVMYFIHDTLVADEDSARRLARDGYQSTFVRLLTDRPIEIEEES